MSENILNSLYNLKKDFDVLKSEEDLVSRALEFLKSEELIHKFISLVTINEFGNPTLYGVSQFPSKKIEEKKMKYFLICRSKQGLQ